jgi:hypothetical protein
VVAETSDVEHTLELEFSNFSANVPPIIILCTVTVLPDILLLLREKNFGRGLNFRYYHSPGGTEEDN